ncbi:MAG: plasmid partitioning protein RepB C-terminal domain-containing protein [Terrimicrobiaceae bacterium]
MNTLQLAFDKKCLLLPLEDLLPVRTVKSADRTAGRFSRILNSVREVGVIEPLMVYPQENNKFLLLDGHLRFYALKELNVTEVECLVSTEDESFTYNARVSRLAPIQEHSMIVKAVKNGVALERIAAALDLDPSEIRAKMNLLTGIHPEAVELVKDKQISEYAIRALKKVHPIRQIEMAELMVSANNFTKAYAEALVLGTKKEQMLNPEKDKSNSGMSAEEIAKLEREMESLERDFKAVEESYGENMLNLTVARGYVKKLIDNVKIVRFLSTNYADVLTEFEAFVSSETL